MDMLVRIITYLAVILLSVMFLGIVFGPKKYMIAIAVMGFVIGLTFGIFIKGIPSGLLTGSFVGFLLDILLIPSGLLARYYRNIGISRLKRHSKEK